MFNVLVSFDGRAWESTDVLSMMKERFKEYSGTDSNLIALQRPESLSILESSDAILLYEDGSVGPCVDVARIGKIQNLQKWGLSIRFRFREIGRVPFATVVKHADLLNLELFEFSSTHWAIKDGNIDKAVLKEMVLTQPRYDIALSFAGEDREYVKEVADFLSAHHVAVYYDKFEKVEMWGKELTEHFDDVFRLQIRA